MNMNMFKTTKRVGVRFVPNTNNSPFHQDYVPVYKEVTDMKKVGIFSGAVAVVVSMLVGVAMLSMRGGNSAGASDVTTTTTVVEHAHENVHVEEDKVRYVCDMPASTSMEYDISLYNRRDLNATMWKEQGITLVFEWTLSADYDVEYAQFTEAVNAFAVYTGLKTQVIKGYDETAANINLYEGYLWNKERLAEELAEIDGSPSYFQENVDKFESEFDLSKIGINVILDDSEYYADAAAYVMPGDLTFGITTSYINKTFFVNGKGESQWEGDYMHTVLHELGHVVGLHHTHVEDDGITQGDSIMSYESNRESYYLAGDIAGLQYMFCR